jgi:hypothetical protein
MSFRRFGLTLTAFLTLGILSDARATGYFEAGTSLAAFNNAASFFGQSQASSTSGGIVCSLGVFDFLTKENAPVRLDMGVQLRISSTTASSSGDPLDMGTFNAILRAEFYRFFAGIGYSPVTWVSKPQAGFTSLHLNPNSHAYLWEAGAIWRVIPEFQIIAVMGMEYGSVSGNTSPAPVTEYGLHFRFPFNPKEGGSGKSASFDGFRYPFGVMK